MSDKGNSTDQKPSADKVAHRSEARIELARQVAAFEHAALKPLYLLNGGGAIALLAFVGQIWTKDGGNQPVIIGVASAIEFFVIGLICAVVATFTGYLQQQWFFKGSGDGASSRYIDAGHISRFVAWVSSVASLVAFAWGCFAALEAFVGVTPALHSSLLSSGVV